MEYPKLLGSSKNPEKMALKIKGALVGLIPLIIGLSGMFGVTVSITEITTLFDSMYNFVIGVIGAWSLWAIAWGSIRHFISKFKN